ncbi:MAG: helix-turn-helix domain-containing protein [Planctomycetota bacterium]|jgi:excisionase family DNA binding protein
MTENELLRVMEVAKILQVSTQTVRNLINEGLLPGVKISPNKKNSPMRVYKADLEEYMFKLGVK